MHYFTAGWITLALLLTACSTSDQQPMPETGPISADFGTVLSQPYREILFQASTWEILAIDPIWPTEDSRADPTTLHGYTVRGRADLPERALRLELLESLADGAREDDGMVAACFNPRHAIRAEFEGKVCEIIICFECQAFQVWNGSEFVENVDLSETPRATFDRIYMDAGLSIAPRGH